MQWLMYFLTYAPITLISLRFSAFWSVFVVLIERWLDEAKGSCIIRHRGVQLILAYIWARPAILAAGKGRGGCFCSFCFSTFIHFPFYPVPLFNLLYIVLSLLSLFSLSLGDDTKWPTRVYLPLNPNSIVVRMKKSCILTYPKCAQWRFWSDCDNPVRPSVLPSVMSHHCS